MNKQTSQHFVPQSPGGNGTTSSAPFETLSQPPPPYTPSLLVPLWAARSQSKRYYFLPPSQISAILAFDRSVVLANQTQKKTLELFLPEGFDFQTFLDQYLPHFVTLGPAAQTDQRARGSYIAINPLNIVEIYSDSSSPKTQTMLDLLKEKAGRGDHADGETVQQFTLRMALPEVLARVDPVGYQRMLRTMPNTDMGFGIRLGNFPRVDYPRLIVASR